MSLWCPCPGHLSLPPANSGPRWLLQPRLFLFTAVLGNDFSGPRRPELAESSGGSLLLLRVGGVRGGPFPVDLFSHPSGKQSLLEREVSGPGRMGSWWPNTVKAFLADFQGLLLKCNHSRGP